MNQRGITLAGVVLGVAVMGIVVVGGASLIQIQTGSALFMTQRSELFTLKTGLIRVVQNPDVCTCQLNAPTTHFDSRPNASLPRTITLPRIREGCAASDPILAEPAQRIADGLFVDRVELTDIVPTGNPNEWRGKYRILMRPTPGVTSLAPVELHVFFMADAASVASNPAQARIASCRAPVTPGLLNSCPPGYTLVGGPSTFSAFCIHQTEQPDARFMDAKLACASDRPAGFGPAHMCTRNEWTLACQADIDPTFKNSNIEWFPDNDGDVAGVLGNGNCNPAGFRDYTGADGQMHNYRCCIK